MTQVQHERPLVAIVVVGYNEKLVTSECLRSLEELDYNPLLVFYVDNDSPDRSLEHIRAHFPKVIAMASGGNLGYCGGNNAGINRALEANAGFVLILNPDTVVCNSRFLTTLVDYMAQHPEVGKVGPKVYLREKGVVQNTILGWPSIWGSFCSVLERLVLNERLPRSQTVTLATDVPSLNGCCLLVRSKALKDVGLYDAGFWGYMDEVDWDWQAEKAGWKRHYVPVESIIHLQKSAGYDFASRANYYMKRNTAIWYAKTGKWLALVAWIGITLSIAVSRAVFAPLLGRSPVKYARFAGNLAVAYAGVVMDALRGKFSQSVHSVGPAGARA